MRMRASSLLRWATAALGSVAGRMAAAAPLDAQVAILATVSELRRMGTASIAAATAAVTAGIAAATAAVTAGIAEMKSKGKAFVAVALIAVGAAFLLPRNTVEPRERDPTRTNEIVRESQQMTLEGSILAATDAALAPAEGQSSRNVEHRDSDSAN